MSGLIPLGLQAANENCPTLEEMAASYRFPFDNGLYATVVGYQSVKPGKLPNQRKIELAIPTFRDKVPVRAILQAERAPLTILLLGIFGSTSGRFERVWPGWLAEHGHHVLTLDSTFLPYFTKASRTGPAGNVEAEAERISEIIAAFLERPEVRGRVSEIGVVGISYGAIEALQLGRMAARGQLPFEINALNAFSPPLRLDKTAEMIDEWHRKDRWKYTLAQLSSRVGDVKPGADVSDSELRAAIAAEMRLNLTGVVMASDSIFGLNALPRGNEFDDYYKREEYAQAWTFSKYMHDIAYPYWREQRGYRSFDDFAASFDVHLLLKEQPAYSRTFLTMDDPLNRPEDAELIRRHAAHLGVVILPNGGHLGYVGTPWVRERLTSLYECAGQGNGVPVSARK